MSKKHVFTFFLFVAASCWGADDQKTPIDASDRRHDSLSHGPEVPPSEDPTRPSSSLSVWSGGWFTIDYPSSFSVWKEGKPQSDEAYFTSPDGTVEFYVFSPLWAGEPVSYLKQAPHEVLLDESLEEPEAGACPNGECHNSTVTLRKLFRAKDGSYYRAFVSIKRFYGPPEAGQEYVHLVFGIRFRDWDVHKTYKGAYLAFKNSLIQYSDGYVPDD